MVDKRVGILAIVAIILGIILVFICSGGASMLFKPGTDLNITSNSTLNNGDDFTVKLTDDNGNGIANKTIQISLSNNSKKVNELNITTDENGVASFGINANTGNYSVKCVFSGDGEYGSSNIAQDISITNTVVLLNQSTDEASSNSKTSDSDDDDYQRPTTFNGGKEHLTAHETDVLNGWDPTQHEVGRENLPDGTHKIFYDDDYFRICDDHGYVISWGYGY